MRAMNPILSRNTKSGKLNGRLWQKALRNTEQRGESPAKTLSGAFRASSFCNASQ